MFQDICKSGGSATGFIEKTTGESVAGTSVVYLVHLMGCALSGRIPKKLPKGLSWNDVLFRARENGILGLVWHAARGLDGIPEDARRSYGCHS